MNPVNRSGRIASCACRRRTASSAFATVAAGLLAAAAALLSAAPAAGAVVFVETNINNGNGGESPHDVTRVKTGTDHVEDEDTFGPNRVSTVGSAVADAIWSARSFVYFEGSAQYRGSGGWAVVEITITDQVLIDMPGVPTGQIISWMQPLEITGSTGGSATAPGHFEAVGSYLVKFGGQEVAGGSQHVTENGFISTMPEVAAIFFQAPANVAGELNIRLGAAAVGWVIDDEGAATATADYGNTFTWGEATNVMNLTTGQPIDAADFHLIGADGFDWAHPVPEPATGLLALSPALAALSARRRQHGRSPTLIPQQDVPLNQQRGRGLVVAAARQYRDDAGRPV